VGGLRKSLERMPVGWKGGSATERGTCDGASARGETFGQRAAHDRVFRPHRRLDGREGTCLRTHGKATGVSGSGLLTYGQLKLLPQWDPLRGDPRFEKIVASLAPKKAGFGVANPWRN
jgi:hypothetical protein